MVAATATFGRKVAEGWQPEPELPARRDPTDPEWVQVARHEAGHAVAAIETGTPFAAVTLRPPTRLHLRGALLGPQHRSAWTSTTIRLAGPIAGWLLAPGGRDDDHLEHGSPFDLGRSLDAIRAAGVEPLNPESVCAAIGVQVAALVLGEWRATIEHLAAELLHHPRQSLTRAEVERIMDWTPGYGLNWLLDDQRERLTQTKENDHAVH